MTNTQLTRFVARDPRRIPYAYSALIWGPPRNPDFIGKLQIKLMWYKRCRTGDYAQLSHIGVKTNMDIKVQIGALIVILILGSVLLVSKSQEPILKKKTVAVHITAEDQVLKKEIMVFCQKALADLDDQASFVFSDNVDRRTDYDLKIIVEAKKEKDEVFVNVMVLVIRRYDPNNIKDLIIPGKWEECVQRLDDLVVGVSSGYYRDHRGNLANIIREVIKMLNQEIKKNIKPLNG